MTLQKLIRHCLLAALCLLMAASRAAEPELVVNLSGHPDFAPFMQQQGDRITGIIPDIVGALLQRSAIRADFSYVGPWVRVQNEAQNGGIDGIAGIYQNKERQEYLAFTGTPLIRNDAVVVVRRGDKLVYRNWHDLKGRKLGRLKGDAYPPDFERFLNQNGIKGDMAFSAEQNLRKLIAGRIDTIVYSRMVMEALATKQGLLDRITIQPTPVFSGEFYFAVAKKSPLLARLPEIDKNLRDMQRSGEIARIIKQHQQASAAYILPR